MRKGMLSLSKNNAEKFLLTLKTGASPRMVVAPIEERGATKFAYWTPAAKLALARNTYYSHKKFFFSPHEPLLKFSKQGKNIEARPVTSESSMAIFGLRPCDLAAIEITDKFFSAQGFVDNNYWARRKNAVIIGVNCVIPGKHCFCDSMGTRRTKGVADLFLHDAGSRWLVEVLSFKGEQMVSNAMHLLEESVEEPLPEVPCLLKADVAAIESVSEDSLYWQSLAKKCLSCSACNMVCPTCTCFDVEDELDLAGENGQRSRRWTSCTLNSFSEVAGGHCFRCTTEQKSRCRVQHKLNWFKQEFGRFSCTGCGRCSAACPTKVSIADFATAVK